MKNTNLYQNKIVRKLIWKNIKEKLKKEKKSREENVVKSQFEKNRPLDHYTRTHKKEHKTNINKD